MSTKYIACALHLVSYICKKFKISRGHRPLSAPCNLPMLVVHVMILNYKLMRFKFFI